MDKFLGFLERSTEKHLTKRRRIKLYEKSQKRTVLSEIKGWIDALVFAIFWVIIINQYLFQLFVIPSPSMVDTLNVGDRVIVNKDSYGVELYPAGTKVFTDARRVQRDQIITFYNPEYDSKGPLFDILSQVVYMGTLTLVNIDRNDDGTPAERLYVKRAVGMPGDVVNFSEGDAYIELSGTDGFIAESDFRKASSLVDGPSRSVDKANYPGLRAAGRLTAYQEAGLSGRVPLHTVAEYQTIMMLDGLLTRVSVGIQSLDEKTLRTLGRNASAESARKALSVLSGLPFDFNADIITAVPGQSIGSSLHDIEEIASYGPGHISLYCLTFEEGTPLARQLVPLDGDEEADFLTSCWKLLGELGYRHYEISNFAKPGKECLHNKVYWNLGQYIGFGPGAESSVGYRKAVSMRDSDTLDGFLRRPEQTVSFLSEDETEEEYLLVSLRTASGIQKREYGERFSHSFDQRYGAFIDKLEKNWYVNDDDHFSLTEAGFLFLDRIILELAMAI